ncbi:hypothetical protein NTGM5_840010 [Candidatus Nitrotoga sp. M5]|nr:hypothetical protein NTGM5_840010 [Candidatus Nitrotoga sp. M5]
MQGIINNVLTRGTVTESIRYRSCALVQLAVLLDLLFYKGMRKIKKVAGIAIMHFCIAPKIT